MIIASIDNQLVDELPTSRYLVGLIQAISRLHIAGMSDEGSREYRGIGP